MGALSLFCWNLRDSDSMGQLMRALGAPEVSAASGGCSEPERAGQRRRAMRAHDYARSQRDTPQPDESLEAHHKKAGHLSCLFYCTSPCGAASPFAPTALRFSSQGLSG